MEILRMVINQMSVKVVLRIKRDLQLNQYSLSLQQIDLQKLTTKIQILEFWMKLQNKEKLKCQKSKDFLRHLRELKLKGILE